MREKILRTAHMRTEKPRALFNSAALVTYVFLAPKPGVFIAPRPV